MIKCYVENCSKLLKNKLAVSHHIKMSSINCKEHKNYLDSLHQSINKMFFDLNLSIYDIGKNTNLSHATILQIWKKNFSKEQILQRSANRSKILDNLRKEKSLKTSHCKNCHKEIKDYSKNGKLFCNKKCYFEYRKKHPEEFNSKKHVEFFCVRCKNVSKNHICKKCRSIERHEKFTREFKCSNCSKIIRRYINEDHGKDQKDIIKFCDKKCYLEFCKKHPEKFLKQRTNAGFASIKSFREKKNFIYAGIKFSSQSEKQCAIFLEKEFDLKLEERKTCHVQINGIEVDFLFHNVVIEYHQCFINNNLSLSQRIENFRKHKYRYEYRTEQEYYNSRKKKLPDNLRLFVITAIREKNFEKLKQQINKEIFLMNKEQIDNMRKALDTLPDRTTKKTYDYVNALEVCYVGLTDSPVNPYRNIVNAALSTWGSAELGSDSGSCHKWSKIEPKNRFIVTLSALTGNTLPLALENVKYQFCVNNSPRHTFDQYARARLASHQSIGCRDNTKINAPFVLYPELYNGIQSNPELKEMFENWVEISKDLYEYILGLGVGSFQTARAVLPMSYNHSFTSSIDLLSLKAQMSRRLMACEESPIVIMFWKLREEIKKQTPLIANYLRPACDSAKKCIYHGGAEGLTKYFSNLFKGCGRWPDEAEYAEFNRSCSDYSELSKYVEVVPRDGWINFTENDYEKLDIKDKELFEMD